MTRLEFDDLVAKLEEHYRERTPALTRTALRWAIGGYIALAIGFILIAAIIAGCIWMVVTAPNGLTIKIGAVIGLACLAVGIAILRGVWVRLSPPDGPRVDRHDAPRLFELIDSVSEKADGARFDHVLITPDLNASVVQIPRLGIFGWHKAYLSIGLPLLDSLSPEEFHAVLAHEFAHLSRSHGRTGNWLYRIRRTWAYVAESLAEQGGFLVKPFHAFISWFWPRFDARAFVLSRHNEYEADAFAATATSPRTAGLALQRIELEARRLDEQFWKPVALRALSQPEPPASLFADLSGLLRTPADPELGSRWLGEALATTTGTSDTHPGLRDRLTALGVEAESATLPLIPASASDSLLGSDLATKLRDQFSLTWLDAHREDWKLRHAEAKLHRDRIEELANGPQTLESRREILICRCQLEGAELLLAEIEAWLAEHPDDLPIHYLLGSHLLDKGDPRGLEHLEKVASSDPASTQGCFGNMAAFHDRQGNAGAIRELKRRADEHDELVARAIGERQNASKDDTYLPHALSPAEIGKCREAIEREEEVTEAWIVRRQPAILPDWPHYVVIIRIKLKGLRISGDQARAELLQRVCDALPLNGYVLVLPDASPHKPPAKRIKTIDGARLLPVQTPTTN